MFAYVKFHDGVKTITSVSSIKNFNPIDQSDFSSKLWYKVLWSGETMGPEGEKSVTTEYYKAQILKLGESKEILEKEVNAKRIQIPKLMPLEESSILSDDPEEDHPINQKSQSNIKEKKQKAKISSDKNLVNNFLKKRKLEHEQFSAEQEVEKLKLEVAKLKKKLRNKEEECQSLRRYNLMFQERLFKEKVTKEVDLVPLSRNVAQCSSSLGYEQSVAHVTPDVSPAKVFPIASPPASVSVFRPRESSSPMVHQMEEPSKTNHPQSSPIKEQAEEKDKDMSSADDDNVDIGYGVKIPQATLKILNASKSPSLFTKGLAVAIWGSSTLKARSTKGMVCNRLKKNDPEKVPRQRLTPVKMEAIKSALGKWLDGKNYAEDMKQAEIRNVAKRIGEKISDLNRQKNVHL